MRLKDKIAVITGGGSGIGRATAIAMGREGATVVIGDLNLQKAEEVSQELVSQGSKVMPVKVNVAQGEDISYLIGKTLEKFGRVDIMVNNAGVNSLTSILDMTKEEWDRVMDINLWGVFLGCQAVFKPMQQQRSGKIVNISSVVGKMGGIFSGVNYSASKAGVICVTKCFAKALAPYGVNVNVICPGPIDTPLHKNLTPEQRQALIKSIPLGRFGEPEDIAEAVLFLSSDAAKFITGAVLDVTGGLFLG